MAKTKINAFDTAVVALMTAITVVCSLVSVPLGSIPVTLQTFAVCVSVGILGMKKGTLSVLLYLALGAVGLPVFSGFQGGIGALLGPTGGYALGFVPFAITAGLVIDSLGRKIHILLLSFAAGLVLCYTVGTLWFVFVYSQGKTDIVSALYVCVLPYIVPDAVKLILAALVTKAVSERIKI